jgi:hypothetical protein
MRYRLARIAWLTNKSLIRSRSQRTSHVALRSPDFAHVGWGARLAWETDLSGRQYRAWASSDRLSLEALFLPGWE